MLGTQPIFCVPLPACVRVYISFAAVVVVLMTIRISTLVLFNKLAILPVIGTNVLIGEGNLTAAK